MSRLPTVGGDDGTWGTVLNDYLSVQHNSDGTHSLDAANISYTPSTVSNWNSSADPGQTDDGLDQLASRVKTVENGVAGIDPTAVHDNVSGEISAITAKASPVGADLLIIEDSAASYAKKKITISTLPAASITRMIIFTSEGSLTTQTGAVRLYNKLGASYTISRVFIAVGTAPTGASIIVDVNKNGTTLFTTQSNRPTIVASANTGETTTIENATFADGDYLTMDIDQVGSTITGSNLSVHVVFS